MTAIRQKSELLPGYLEYLVGRIEEEGYAYRFITPKDPAQRGAQLSFLTGPEGKRLFDYLMANGVVCDWREHRLPTQDAGGGKAGVIRIAPAPLYNRFEDVYELVQLLRQFPG